MDLDFQDDNDSDSDFDEKIKKSYQQHKVSRPNSSRPETASRFREDHDRHQFLLPFQVYAKITSYIYSLHLSKFTISSRLGEYPNFQKFL